ncbi:MAG: LuxR C-terminal-related transcriptional regulator [Bacteroidaceae bacterium]
MEIAIITPNRLEAEGLRHLIRRTVVDEPTIRFFSSYGALMDDTSEMYDWYFVNPQTYALYNAFFQKLRTKCILLIQGSSTVMIPEGTNYIDTMQSREKIGTALRKLVGDAINDDTTKTSQLRKRELQEKRAAQWDTHLDLSQRELEVLRQVVLGYINKEIADKLSISLTTVITHRKHITEKLGIKSVSGLAVYAIMNGIVSADEV